MSRIKKDRCEHADEEMQKMKLSETLRRSVELTSKKGASNWLTALPIDSHGVVLHKEANVNVVPILQLTML